MESRVRRDVRRFLFFRWRLLEVPNNVPVNLLRVWKERYGFLPPFAGGGAIAGFHFLIGDDVRGVKIERPDKLQLLEPSRKRLCSVIAAKHSVAEVRLAPGGEIPDLRIPDRLPRPRDRDRVEEWPAAQPVPEPIVAESAVNPGLYVCESSPWATTTASLEQAAFFVDVGEAEQHLDLVAPNMWVVLRYRAACLAEADQREAAAIDGRACL